MITFAIITQGTKLEERLARGDKGINPLDEACKLHDIAYSNHKDSSERYKADKELSKAALSRVFSRDAGFKERATALAVSAAMKAKTGLTKLGSGMMRRVKGKRKVRVGAGLGTKPRRKSKSRRKTKVRQKRLSFQRLVKNARIAIRKSKPQTINEAISTALQSVKKTRKGKKVDAPKRIIQLPKSGGILPIVPILAGLSALGSVASSAVGVYKTINEIRNANKRIAERNENNVKVGNGLYLKPYKGGNGLYLQPYKGGKGLYLKPYSKN